MRMIWEGPPPTAEGAELVLPVLVDDFRRNGRKPAMFAIVGAASELPDEGARRRGAMLAAHMSCYVAVHEGGSLRASVLRMVVASIVMLSSQRADTDIVSTVEEGVERLLSRSPGLPATLLDDVMTLRRRVQAAPSQRRARPA
jgi:hypothetical protein